MDKICEKIRDLNQNIKSHIDNGKDPKKLLNYTQFQIIKYLIDHSNDNVCQKDLEIETKLNKASITGTIDSLEEKGLVKRIQAESDKRKNYIVVTQKVENIKKEFAKRIETIDKLMVSGLSKEEIDIFFKVIEKMNKNLSKEK